MVSMVMTTCTAGRQSADVTPIERLWPSLDLEFPRALQQTCQSFSHFPSADLKSYCLRFCCCDLDSIDLRRLVRMANDGSQAPAWTGQAFSYLPYHKEGTRHSTYASAPAPGPPTAQQRHVCNTLLHTFLSTLHRLVTFRQSEMILPVSRMEMSAPGVGPLQQDPLGLR